MMPLTAVARQSRPLDTKYSTDFAATHFRSQAFEPGPVNPTRTASPQIVINDYDARETHGAGPFHETELEACAFLVVNQLARLGLANIDDSFPGKTFRSKFRIHPLLRFQVA